MPHDRHGHGIADEHPVSLLERERREQGTESEMVRTLYLQSPTYRIQQYVVGVGRSLSTGMHVRLCLKIVRQSRTRGVYARVSAKRRAQSLLPV